MISLFLLFYTPVFVPQKASCDWVENMKEVHARFSGRKGTFAHFGDSITVTMAFWSPLPYARKNAPPEMERAFLMVSEYMQPECWRDWKGPQYGNDGSMTIQWAYENIDQWLRGLNPETALIMFGSNDLHTMDLDEYQSKMRAVAQKCLDNGTVVILSTPPPRIGFQEKGTDFAKAVREIACELKLPLIDYYGEIIKRRPEDWDGSLEKFSRWEGYDVPTLLSRDGVHPSHPQKYQNDYSEEALSNCGYSLRNYLALMKYAEEIETVLRIPYQSWFPKAPELAPPQGDAIRVDSVESLFRAVEHAMPGSTIIIADGHYNMPRYLEIHTDNVTLRSESGQRERVILDGAQSIHGELVGITRCAGVTIADLTIQNIKWNGFKINSDTNVQNVTIYNCIIHNIWQRGVKGVRVPEENIRPRNCRVQYCLFYNDHPKSFSDDPRDTSENFNGNYVGGIDVMFAKNWVISDNVFIGIQGRTRSARGAIFMWHDSQDCVIERNIIIDCDTGIALGNSHRPEDIETHCTRFIVRNNFITRCPESNIVADYTKDCRILHNTVHDPQNRLGRLIRIVHDNDGLLVSNNLLSGPKIRSESTSQITFKQNLEKDMTDYFMNPSKGNLHLKKSASEAINKAALISEMTEDIDRQTRSQTPDIGADEVF